MQRQQLGVLLNTGGALVSIDTTTRLLAPLAPADTAGLNPEANPTLAALRQEVTVSQQQTRVQQLRRLPDVRAGYFNQTINQQGGFNVGQLGVSVPQHGRSRRLMLGLTASICSRCWLGPGWA